MRGAKSAWWQSGPSLVGHQLAPPGGARVCQVPIRNSQNKKKTKHRGGKETTRLATKPLGFGRPCHASRRWAAGTDLYRSVAKWLGFQEIAESMPRRQGSSLSFHLLKAPPGNRQAHKQTNKDIKPRKKRKQHNQTNGTLVSQLPFAFSSPWKQMSKYFQ